MDLSSKIFRLKMLFLLLASGEWELCTFGYIYSAEINEERRMFDLKTYYEIHECYSAIDMFLTWLFSPKDRKLTQISSVGILYKLL